MTLANRLSILNLCPPDILLLIDCLTIVEGIVLVVFIVFVFVVLNVLYGCCCARVLVKLVLIPLFGVVVVVYGYVVVAYVFVFIYVDVGAGVSYSSGLALKSATGATCSYRLSC